MYCHLGAGGVPLVQVVGPIGVCVGTSGNEEESENVIKLIQIKSLHLFQIVLFDMINCISN